MLSRLLTKNYTKIPLLWISFNLKKYKKDGAKNSCVLHIHPSLQENEYVIETMKNLCDYIRENYDMEEIT